MRVETAGGEVIQLGATETTPTISITDYSRRETDDFGVTTVVERGFSRRLSVRLAVESDQVDGIAGRLTDLRAASALWVASDDLEWLAVEGFYKDFDLDLAVPPLSYCTLTVEGIAESEVVADTGGDPAPVGLTSTLRLVQPVAITDAVLTTSNVAEADYAEWSAGTSYPAGARVIKMATHRIYESVISANVAHDPATQDGQWLDVGPTNRWAMFDQALGTATSAAAITVTLLPGVAVSALALLDVDAGSVRVQAAGYDRTQAVTVGKTVTFLDLAVAPGGSVTVTIDRDSVVTARTWDDSAYWSDAETWHDTAAAGGGSGDVSVGTLLVGQMVALGVTEASPTAGITDYSRKEVDDFGEVTVVQRAYAKRMSARALIRTDAVDVVANRIAAVRARPSLWIGDANTDSLTTYGFFRDFSIEVGETLSKLSLSIEGLSKAAPLPAAFVPLVPRGAYAAGTIYGAGDLVQQAGSSWLYINAAASAGNAPPALPSTENAYWRVFAAAGRDGFDGEDGTNGTNGLNGSNGQSVHIAYADAPDGTVNFTTGDAGGRTFIGVYTDTNPGADSTNPASYGWTRLRGLDGTNGIAGPGGYVHFAYANNATGTLDFHVSDPTGRSYLGVYTDQLEPDSTDPAAYTWSRIRGENGTNGTDGINGTNGQSIHIAYADAADGSVNFTTGDAGGRTFIGVYTDTNPGADSSDPAHYGWTRLRGLDGTNGLAGPGGYVHTAYANSADGAVDFHLSDPTGRRYLGAYTDQLAPDSTSPSAYAWSLIKGADGTNGTNGVDGAPAVVASLSISSFVIGTDSNFVVKPGQLPRTSALTVKSGSTDGTGSASVTVTTSSTDIVASYSAGTVTISQVNASGYVDVAVSYGGVSLGAPLRIQLSRIADAAPPQSQTSAGGDISLSLDATSYVPIGDSIMLKANGSGQLVVAWGAEYTAQGSTSVRNFVATGAFAYSAGGAPSYFGVATGSNARTLATGEVQQTGSISIGGAITGLTPGAVYTLYPVAYRSGGTSGAIADLYGSYTVHQ